MAYNVSTMPTVSFTYDFEKDGNGDAFGFIKTGLQIPNKTVILWSIYFCNTTLLASAGAPLIGVGTTLRPAWLIFPTGTPCLFNNFIGNTWANAIAPIFVDPMDDSLDITVQITAGKLSQGKFTCYIQYFT